MKKTMVISIAICVFLASCAKIPPLRSDNNLASDASVEEQSVQMNSEESDTTSNSLSITIDSIYSDGFVTNISLLAVRNDGGQFSAEDDVDSNNILYTFDNGDDENILDAVNTAFITSEDTQSFKIRLSLHSVNETLAGRKCTIKILDFITGNKILKGPWSIELEIPSPQNSREYGIDITSGISDLIISDYSARFRYPSDRASDNFTLLTKDGEMRSGRVPATYPGSTDKHIMLTFNTKIDLDIVTAIRINDIEYVISPQLDLQVLEGTFLALADFGHSGFGDFIHFSTNMPADWKTGEAIVDAQFYHVIDKATNDYVKTIKVWGYYCTNENGRKVDSFLLNYEKLEELKTPKGKKLYRATTFPDSLVYAFMADETLAIVVEMSETGVPVLDSEPLYDLQIGNFCDRFMVLDKRQGNEKDPVPDFSAKSYVQLTDGAGKAAATTLNVGDSFLGWTADKIEYYDDSNMIVKFSGKATIKCRLSYPAHDELFGYDVSVYVADESLPLLPYSVTDSRDLWFILENSEEVIQALGGKSFDLSDCEIVIDSYTIYRRPGAFANTATVQAVNYAR